MRVLFDHGTPRGIARSLQNHTLSNGELLKAAEEAGFDVLLTTDENLRHQQHHEGRKLAIVVLGNSRWSLVRRRLDQIASAINAAKPGTYTLVDISV